MDSVLRSRRRSPSEVCIVGCGAVTALGHSAPMTAASVRANLSRCKEIAYVDKTGQPIKLSRVEIEEDSCRGIDRLTALAVPAAMETVSAPLQQKFAKEALEGAAICVGTASQRPGARPDAGQAVTARVAEELSICGSLRKQHAVAAGHASALIALQQAHAWIVAGAEEFVLVGGVDSYYDADTLDWLDDNKRLHSEANADGFVPGEGSAFCLLTSLGIAARYNMTPLAVVAAPCSTVEPNPMTSDGICLGEGLTSALRRTLNAALAGGGKADWILCDMNGESFRGTEWVYAYLRTGKHFVDPLEIWHPADCYGDVGAASGTVLIILAIEAWARNYARGNRALLWTSSDGSERAAVLLENP